MASLNKGIYGLTLKEKMEWLQLSDIHSPADIICGSNSNLLVSTSKLLILNTMKFFHLMKFLSKLEGKSKLEDRTLECYNFNPKSQLESPLFFRMLCKANGVSACFNLKISRNSNKDCGDGLLAYWRNFDNLVTEVSKTLKDREKRSILEMSMFGGGVANDLSTVISGLEQDRQNLLQLTTNQREISQALSSLAVKVNENDLKTVVLSVNDLGLREALQTLIAKASRLIRDFQDLSSEILSVSDSITTAIVQILRMSAESNLGNRVCFTDADKIICYISPIKIGIYTDEMTLTGVGQNLGPAIVPVLHCVPNEKGLFIFNNQYVLGEDSRTLIYSNNKIRNKNHDDSYFDPNLVSQVVKIPPCYYHPTEENVLISCKENLRIRISNATYINLGAFKSALLSKTSFPIITKGQSIDYNNLLFRHEKKSIWVAIQKQQIVSTDFIPELISYHNRDFLWKGLTFKEIFVSDLELQKSVYGFSGGVALLILIFFTCCCCCLIKRRRRSNLINRRNHLDLRQSTPTPRYNFLRKQEN